MSFAGDHEDSRASDDAAFREYVLARGAALLRMAVMLTGNRADAEDLVQAALAKTYLAWDKINDHAALDAYVRRAMINTHISWWRRRKLDEFPTDELPDQAVADHARDSDLAEVVRRALDRLPDRMRRRHAQVLRGHDRAGNRRPARGQPGHGEEHRVAGRGQAAHRRGTRAGLRRLSADELLLAGASGR
jgi:RNA polymerase sigma factor (sigma-70 family)